jgi:rhodanese-related sulfurtransferase
MRTAAKQFLGFVGAGVVAVSLLGGCKSTSTSDADIQVMRESELVELLDSEKDRPLLIDVRLPSAYAAGHLPGAINIPVARIDNHHQDPRLTGAREIVVYSADWEDPLGRVAAKKLMAAGFGNVYELKGGVALWTGSGHSLVRPLGRAMTRPESN